AAKPPGGLLQGRGDTAQRPRPSQPTDRPGSVGLWRTSARSLGIPRDRDSSRCDRASGAGGEEVTTGEPGSLLSPNTCTAFARTTGPNSTTLAYAFRHRVAPLLVLGGDREHREHRPVPPAHRGHGRLRARSRKRSSSGLALSSTRWSRETSPNGTLHDPNCFSSPSRARSYPSGRLSSSRKPWSFRRWGAAAPGRCPIGPACSGTGRASS